MGENTAGLQYHDETDDGIKGFARTRIEFGFGYAVTSLVKREVLEAVEEVPVFPRRLEKLDDAVFAWVGLDIMKRDRPRLTNFTPSALNTFMASRMT